MFGKLHKIFVVCGFLFAFGAAAHAAPAGSSEFQMAAQLLTAARAGNTVGVAALVNAGANVNFIDNTGLSVVCTAIMNNDMRAAQILQVHGADASKCDQQIRQFNQRLPKEESGGMFSGLSTTQRIALTVAGAAVVVGGVVLIANWLGSPRNRNNVVNGGGNRPCVGPGCDNGGGGNNNIVSTWPANGLPRGPAELATDFNYQAALDFFGSPDITGIRALDFAYFNTATNVSGGVGVQNYLLMMHGYSPLARGYNGMRTIRRNDGTPLVLSGLTNAATGDVPGGGRPVLTALITANGVNASGSSADVWQTWAVCSATNSAGCSAVDTSAATISRKYYNNKVTGTFVSSLGDLTVTEDPSFDLSGNGTVFNSGASTEESMWAKIIAGGYADGRALGDFLGFMPNGQLLIFRTGGGLDNTSAPIDVHNWRAMLMAASLQETIGGLQVNVVDTIANASIMPSMRLRGAATLSDIAALASAPGLTSAQMRTIYANFVNFYYQNPATDTGAVGYTSPGVYADILLNGTGPGRSFSSMLIFGTGEYQIGLGPGQSLAVQEATFENYAPLIYENLNQLFMSVVAVQLTNGTASTTSVSDWDSANFGTSASGPGQYGLSAWSDGTNTYGARACGVATRGTSAVDPWCFAAAGATSGQAVAAMAGAVGVLNGAFAFMNITNQQIFTLLALTADGYMLGTSPSGAGWTPAQLTGYLQEMYVLPNEYQLRVDGGENYLDVFAEVFGYGLINLDRATRAGTRVHYFTNTGRIVTGSGNAYWRTSSVSSNIAAKTALSLGGAFGARAASLSIPVYDIIESIDGSISMPRVFANSFSLTGDRRRHMSANLLGDFKIDNNNDTKLTSDNSPISVNMSLRDNAIDDGYGNIDKLSFGYKSGGWNFGAKYERNMGERNIMRGDASNPLLSLASYAMSSDVKYGAGAWSFGFRGFSGAITEEGLLENDPALSGNYNPMRLGSVYGGEASVEYNAGIFEIASAVGNMHETDTMLGSYSDGLMNLGGGNTMYIDNVVTVRANDKLKFNARYTHARTDTNIMNDTVILGLSDLRSDAMSVGMEFGGWSFNVARPLAVTRGHMQYATANYELADSDNGYDLIADPRIENFDLAPSSRETRLSAAYRARLGEFTTGAVGFIYRDSPDHTRAFGNESILMLKLNHRIGI
ncbi:MAG: hypothetical protein FWG18_01960 [Alphaproteobacteria bacterium]|nr:hypothetical protein [Alphaproteobacteria bacterium]